MRSGSLSTHLCCQRKAAPDCPRFPCIRRPHNAIPGHFPGSGKARGSPSLRFFSGRFQKKKTPRRERGSGAVASRRIHCGIFEPSLRSGRECGSRCGYFLAQRQRWQCQAPWLKLLRRGRRGAFRAPLPSRVERPFPREKSPLEYRAGGGREGGGGKIQGKKRDSLGRARFQRVAHSRRSPWLREQSSVAGAARHRDHFGRALGKAGKAREAGRARGEISGSAANGHNANHGRDKGATPRSSRFPGKRGISALSTPAGKNPPLSQNIPSVLYLTARNPSRRKPWRSWEN